MRRSACQTRCWKAVPRRSSGRSSACFGSLDEVEHGLHRVAAGPASSATIGRVREAPAQVAQQRLVRFGKADEADALVGGADQQAAERAVGEGGADRLAVAAAPRPRPGSCRAARRSSHRPGFPSRSRPRPPRRPRGRRRRARRAAGGRARPRRSCAGVRPVWSRNMRRKWKRE